MLFSIKRNVLFITCSILSLTGVTSNVLANTTIKFLDSKYSSSSVPTTILTELIKKHFDIDQYRTINFQVIYNENNKIDHMIIYLFSKKYHKVEVARINLNKNLEASTVQRNYYLTALDFAQQPGKISPASATSCPDPSIQFIAFAPNDNQLEQDITNDVANAAEAHSLKTVRLLRSAATSQNYLNYMTCPKLEGNFYDGDANTQLITTVDGVINYHDIESNLKNQFRYKVTNIWLACEAYNEPIKSSVMAVAQSQKYAAGINDLLVGPSDRTAACEMKAAMNGKSMTPAFKSCYKKFDTLDDDWGFGGNGSDIFGT